LDFSGSSSIARSSRGAVDRNLRRWCDRDPAITDQRISRRRSATVVVQATYPGANPKVIAETVSSPLEEQINGVENMMYMKS